MQGQSAAAAAALASRRGTASADGTRGVMPKEPLPMSVNVPLAPAGAGIANRVLVVDDERNMRRLLQDVLEEDGWSVEAVSSAEEALERIGVAPGFGVMVLDLSLPGMNGLELLRQLRERRQEVATVVITAFASVDVAVRAMKAGAVDFLVKPFDNVRLKAALRKVRESADLAQSMGMSQPVVETAPLAGAEGTMEIVGEDSRLMDVFRVIRQVANTKACVLISGESGTGKELAARAIHYNSDRRDRPLVAVNCAATPETLLESEFFGHERGSFTGAYALQRGRFEQADGGTLFLDEIGEMPLALQVKLLRVIQEGTFTRVGGDREVKVDVRLIAATNRDLREAVREKAFREDLFYRLNVIHVHLPPLRERRGDITRLIEYFNVRFSRRHKLPPIAIPADIREALLSYQWPGNIRELQNMVEKAVVLQDPGALLPPTAAEAPSSLPEGAFLLHLGAENEIRPLAEVAADAQRAAVIRALRLCDGNKAKAADRLNISYKTLFNKIHDLDISINTSIE
jgi:two-component system response regulator AtoC